MLARGAVPTRSPPSVWLQKVNVASQVFGTRSHLQAQRVNQRKVFELVVVDQLIFIPLGFQHHCWQVDQFQALSRHTIRIYHKPQV